MTRAEKISARKRQQGRVTDYRVLPLVFCYACINGRAWVFPDLTAMCIFCGGDL